MKKEKKVGVHTIKGGIIEIIISFIILIGNFALTVYDNTVSATPRFYSRFTIYLFIFILSFLSLLDGIMTILVILKDKKKNKNDEDKTDSNDK